MLGLQGVPESLVFSGHWNNQGSAKLYAEFDGTRLLALDTAKLGGAGFGTTPIAFTDACVETCIVAIATSPGVTLVYEPEGGATLDITKYGPLEDIASEPEVTPAPVISPPEPISAPTIIKPAEPTPTSAVIIEPIDEIPADETSAGFGTGSFSTAAVLSACQTLRSANFYTLSTNIVTNRPSCFNITADNVEIDCLGFNITGNRSSSSPAGDIGSHGINASSRTNVTIKNCGIFNFSDGIFFTRVEKATIFNNTFINNSDDGIDLGNNNFTVISHNRITNNSDNGIEVTGWFNNFTNNTISNNRGAATSHGIQTFRGSATIPTSGPATYRIINNTIFDNQNDGLNIAWLNDSVIANNTFFRNADDDISITNGTSINITGNNIASGGDDGIVLDGTNYSFIAFNNISEKSGQNVDILRSHNNNYTNNTIYYGGNDLLRVRLGSSNNTFWNTTLFSNGTWFVINDSATFNNSFFNTTFANSNGSIRLGFFLGNISQEVNQTKLNISSNRTYLNATNLSNMNVSATIILNYTGLTFTNLDPGVDYGDTLTYVTCPADVCTETATSGTLFRFNVSHWTSFAIMDTLFCGQQITNSVTMTENLVCANSAFVVTNDNLTIDCNNYNITYGTCTGACLTGAKHGINVTNRNNVTIQNCNINKNTASFTDPHAILIGSTNHSRILNTVVNVSVDSPGHGISIQSGRNITLTNVRAFSHNNASIELLFGSNNTINNTNGTTEVGDGLSIRGNDCPSLCTVDPVFYTQIIGGRYTSTTGSAINLKNTYNGSFVNVTVLTNTGRAVQFSLVTANYSFINTTILSNNSWILVLEGSGNLSNFSETRFTNANGTIHFMGTFNLTDNANVSLAQLNISANRTYLNATNLTTMNKSANITLFNIALADPRPSVDFNDDGVFATCSASDCTEGSFASSTFNFNVSHWTSFSVESANAAPTINNVILNSTNPATNDTDQNLTVYLNITDADSLLVYNTTDWRIANVSGGFNSIAVLNMPFNVNVSISTPNATRDYTTYQNNGTLGGDAEAPTWNASGRVGGAYMFDATDDFIEINDTPSLNPGKTNLTFMAWIYPSSAGAGRILCKDNGGANRDYCLSWGDAGQKPRFFAIMTGGLHILDALIDLPLNAWSHVAVTYDGTTLKMYLNGTDDATSTFTDTFADSTIPLRIGRSVEGYTFPGSIDEVYIFNRTLSAGQIREHFNQSLNNHTMTVLHANETLVGETWLAAITTTDGLLESATANTNNITIASPPVTALSAPVNLYPANNSNITDRSPNFNWSNSTVGLVNYSLEISTSIDFSVASNIIYNRTNISSLVNANSTNFTINFTLDVDRPYWWRVIAYDATSFSAYSNATNFTLQSYVNFSLPIRNVDFGNATLGAQNDTVDEVPRAFHLQNDGNILINISVTSTRLFLGPSVDYPTPNYRFKARINESDAFNSSNSTMNWTNFSLTSLRMDILDLNWTAEKDDARIDVNITVPLDEPAGLRNATVTFTVP